MKSNFLKLYIFSLIFINYTFSQKTEIEKKTEKVKVFSDFQFGPNLKIFSGNNFLSDAHESSYFGYQIEINALEFKNFTLGMTYEFNASEVEKPELAGNFNYIKLNHYAGYIGYKYKFKETKFTFNPKILIGDIKAKQKAAGYYATNNGNYWGINGQVDYNFSKNVAVFSSIGYNFYTFNVVTTPENMNYFNKSNAINISLGIKF